MLVKLNLYYLTIQIIGAIYGDMNVSPLDEKLSFKIVGLFFSSKLDCRSHNVSIAKAANKKAESLSDSMNFVSSEVALYLCKADAANSYLDMLDKLSNESVGLLILHLLVLLNQGLIAEIEPA